jgi:membrane protease YdiL (CAAX protease family)
VILAVLFVALGWLIYILFSPIRPALGLAPDQASRAFDYVGRCVVVAALLGLTAWLRRSPRLSRYAPLALGFLIMAVLVSLDWILAIYLLDHVKLDDGTPAGFALLKLNEGLVVVGGVILLTKLAGGSLGSIYVQRGNVKLGLIIGLTTFGLAALGAIPMASLFKPQDLTMARILPWLPWGLLFVLANGAQEEMMFRGLFLRKLEPFLGKFGANIVTVFVFTWMHQSANYTSNMDLFLIIVCLLSLAWGYVMQKTDAAWASILFHAGMDLPIMLGIFSGLR